MQRKDYALAEETMKNFAQKHPSDPLIADSQYWLGESYFQRQQYRDAAEAFLGVTPSSTSRARRPTPCCGWPVAGGAEGKGSRLRRARRGDAEISARIGRRQSLPSIVSRSGLSAKAEAGRGRHRPRIDWRCHA